MFKLNINTNFERVMKDTNASPPLSFLCCHFDGVIPSSCHLPTSKNRYTERDRNIETNTVW